jgi:hypothetical protein
MRFWLLALATIAALAPSAAAQRPAPPSPDAQRDEMKKVSTWVGRWEGEGWYEIEPGRRETYRITETIESKLDGLVFLVEGIGRSTDDAGRVVHHALATLSYDEAAKRYRFVSHTEKGLYGEMPLWAIDGGFQWGRLDEKGAGFRYTIRFTDDGRWHETGERSTDGKTWHQFHDMTLRRVGN